MSKNNNFAVIDIGTNAVKCICFSNGKMIDIDEDDTLRNKRLTQTGENDLDPENLLNGITYFIERAEIHHIPKDKVYIVATEGFRRSSNKEQLQQLIKQKTGRLVHLISARREAYLSALGGLSYIRDNFKGQPNKILYIEAGGGSTEVSVFDTSQRGILSMTETCSLPVGSKTDLANVDLSQYNDEISNIMQTIKDGDNVAVVVNSSSAGRILAAHNKMSPYTAKTVAKKQYSIEACSFLEMLKEIQEDNPTHIQETYYLGKGSPNGFISHCGILKYILEQSPDVVKKASLSTTIGGLKLGLATEIENANGNDEEIDNILQKDNITIGNGSTLAEDDGKDSKTWKAQIKNAINKVNQEANGKFQFVLKPNKENNNDKILTYEDKINPENKIQFTSTNNASVSGDIQAYYAICMTAQKLGKKINFGTFKDVEQKALLYQACLEKGVEITNSPPIEEFKQCKNFNKIQKLTQATISPTVIVNCR